MAKPGVSKGEELKKYVAGKTQPVQAQESKKEGTEYTRDYSFQESSLRLDACVTPQRGNVYGNTAYIGSNFTTTNRARAALPICLDSHYSTYLEDSEGKLVGVGIGLGDGNGKGIDKPTTQLIAKMSHDVSQAIVNRMMTFKKAKDLSPTALKQLVDNVANNLKASSDKYGSTSTCVAARTFPTANGERVIGVGIGDSMLIAWEPTKGKFTTLLPSTQIRGGTATYPSTYRAEEINYCDVQLEEGAILIPMSDGISDHLPLETIIDDKETGLKTVALKENEMTELLRGATTPQECIQRITQRALENAQRALVQGRQILTEAQSSLATLEAQFARLDAEFRSKESKKMGEPGGFKDEDELDEMKNRIRKLGREKDNASSQFAHRLSEIEIGMRGQDLTMGDDMAIVGVHVPIKGVEVFRSLLKSRVEISEKSVKARIEGYLSLYPKNERDQIRKELLSQGAEIIAHLEQTRPSPEVAENFYIRLNSLSRVLHTMAPESFLAAAATAEAARAAVPAPVSAAAAAAAASPSHPPAELAAAPSSAQPHRPDPIIPESKLARAKAFRLPQGLPTSTVIKAVEEDKDKKPKPQ